MLRLCVHLPRARSSQCRTFFSYFTKADTVGSSLVQECYNLLFAVPKVTFLVACAHPRNHLFQKF